MAKRLLDRRVFVKTGIGIGAAIFVSGEKIFPSVPCNGGKHGDEVDADRNKIKSILNRYGGEFGGVNPLLGEESS